MASMNWFPGHMRKAADEIQAMIRNVQVVVEVLDARCPFSTENPYISRMLKKSVPYIRVLNKADLADPVLTRQWLNYYNKLENGTCMELQARNRAMSSRVVQAAESLIKRGSHKTSNILVVGIPNVGKSTLINSLAGRKVCQAEDRPAVTRKSQIIALTPTLNLLDTPGFLWPRLDPQECAYRLAISGAIKNSIFDFEDIGLHAIGLLQRLYPSVLYSSLKLPENLRGMDEPAVCEEILSRYAQSSGCLKKGGVVDLRTAAENIVMNFRKSKFGRITLETPEMILSDDSISRKNSVKLDRSKTLKPRKKKVKKRQEEKEP